MDECNLILSGVRVSCPPHRAVQQLFFCLFLLGAFLSKFLTKIKILYGMVNCWRNFFVRGVWGDGAVFIISKNLPLKGKFFEMVSWGVLGGLAPPGIFVTRALPPGGGLGGLRPPGISVNYPCLASAAAVPCPRALPPIFFRPNFFVGIFSPEFFRRNFFRPSSVRHPSVVRPSSVRPSVRPSSVGRPRC